METGETNEDRPFTSQQEEVRMQIRMHIIEESKAEWREMPQEFSGCLDCWFRPDKPQDARRLCC